MEKICNNLDCNRIFKTRNRNRKYCCRECYKISWSKNIKDIYDSGKSTFGFKQGNVSWNIGLTKDNDFRLENISNSRKGKTWDDFYGKDMSNILKQKRRDFMLGKARPEHSKLMKTRTHFLGKENAEKTRKMMIEKWKEPNFRAKQLTQENLKKRLEGLMKRPTSFEQKISNLCFKYNLPFIYKGNGGFLINFKNPDFIDESKRIAIEVFYSWYKIRDYGSVENYKQFCKKKYEPAGWRVIFIDELDLSNERWEDICLNKIAEVSQ